MSENDFRQALAAFFVALGNDEQVAKQEADQAVANLGETIHRNLAGLELYEPADTPAAEAARKRALAVALAWIPVQVPSLAEMQAREAAAAAAIKAQRKQRKAARSTPAGPYPTEATGLRPSEAAALLGLPADRKWHKPAAIQSAFRRKVKAAARNAEAVTAMTMARDTLLSVSDDD